MTRTHLRRRDLFIKGGSVLAGLRCERELAQRLCDFARENVRADLTQPASRANPGDVSEAARYLLRRGVGLSHEAAARVEVAERGVSGALAGLAVDAGTLAQLYKHQQRYSLTRAGTARHLLRLGLGMDVNDSLAREQHFAAIAAVLREIREARE